MSHTSQSADRALGLRMRGDLELARVNCGGKRLWNVKDPVSLRYFQLGEEEHFVLTHLDGQRSLRELQRLAEQRFAPRKLDIRHLQAYLGTLHRQGLTVSSASGQGAILRERKQCLQRQRTWSRLANPLAVRFPGIDPQRLLDWSYPGLRWIFRPAVLWLIAAATLAATMLLISRLPSLATSIPSVHAFLSVSNVLVLAAALCAVKLLHELGHALTCRHFGADCHEMGLMLLVGIPCLYANVSDTWMLPNKWHRIAVSGAGILVEFFVAAICAVVWCFSAPGLLNAISFNLLVICSVNTVLLNGNPLLRFDGYFILSDLVETPNLWHAANGRLRELASRWFLGVRPVEPEQAFALPPWLLVAYGLTSLIYRSLVVLAILWVCLHFFDRHELAPVGHLIVVAVVAGMVFAAAAAAGRKLKDPIWRRKIDKLRLVLAVSATLCLGTTLLLIPVPRTLRVPMTLVPAAADRVYVGTEGVLEWAVDPGEQVQAGDRVGLLRNPQLQWETELADGRWRAQKLVVDQLRRKQVRDAQAAGALSDAEALLETLGRLREEQLRRLDALTLIASSGGRVIPPRERSGESPPAELELWEATPLASVNRGCFLQKGTLFCLIGDPRHVEGEAIVDQAVVTLIKAGQRVRIQPDGAPGMILSGAVAEVDELETEEVPPELITTKRIAVTPEGRPLRKSYRVKLTLELPTTLLQIGGPGTALIYVGRQSFGGRGWLALRRTLFRAPPELTEQL